MMYRDLLPGDDEKLEVLNSEQIDEYQNFARERLGFEYHDIRLLIEALTHRSYVNEHRKSGAHHNERLEFLGDAVLEVVVSDFLYYNYHQSEGVMTAWRSALVRTESICEAGKELGYGPLVRLSKGEKMGTSRAHDVIMADCFEAVVGSIYVDQGRQAAKDFIYRIIISKMRGILEDGSWRDPKSYFQELAQHFTNTTPNYRVTREDGPDHDKTFAVEMTVCGEIMGIGVGHSKQEAQIIAAQQGIQKYRDEHPDDMPVLPLEDDDEA